MPIAYLNGEFQALGDIRISPLDRGFLFGDAVYEVVPIHGGEPLLIDAHVQRLNRSLGALRIDNPHSDAAWRKLVAELTIRNGGGNLAVYIQVTRGADAGRDHAFPDNVTPTVFAMATELVQHDYTDGVSAITLPDHRWGRCDIKATALLANVLAKQTAMEAGAAEAILLWNGDVTEGSVSSVLLVENGEILRRPHGNEVLPGTTTDFVVEVARESGFVVHEQVISEQRLRSADEIWLTGATKGIAPVVELDGSPVGTGAPGPIWRQVTTNFENSLHE
ncbi:MAG: D-amino acid aminotransferase [Gammaproteobacteria bacterium]|nr:aminotransferase class IV [Gammaproteobacteria bacterium]NND37162.1 D-amino acid aminotransferase [Gammaproteobacteria bacterium]